MRKHSRSSECIVPHSYGLDHKREFQAPEKLNVISAPMPKHGHSAHAIEEDMYVAVVDDLMTPLPIIKMNLLKAGIFPGCEKDCYFCSSLQSDCPLLKSGIQRLMDNQEILFQKIPVTPITPITHVTLVTPINDVAIITISDNLPKVCKRPVKIKPDPKFVPLKITMSGATLYNLIGES